MCLHTIILDKKNPNRIYIAISAAGAFRSDDAGKTWKPINKGLVSQYIPDPNAEVGHCVHRVAMHPAKPDTLFMQKHWDVMRSDNSGDLWREVSGNLPTDFGFVIDVHAHDPETIYVAPIKSDGEHFVPEGKLASIAASPAATSGKPSPRASRKAIATSTSFATPWPSTRLTLAASTLAPAAARCMFPLMPAIPGPIVRDLPGVLSVEVQTIP